MLTQEFVDGFTRWMVVRAAENEAAGLPYDQKLDNHPCGTPACIGGYLNAYPPAVERRINFWVGRSIGLRIGGRKSGAGVFANVVWGELFGVDLPFKTPLEAANNMRRLAGLEPLATSDFDHRV